MLIIFAAIGCGSGQGGSSAPPPPSTGNFFLQEGDRVVFYEDSVTDRRLYTDYVETYCTTRFPSNHFTFFNEGWGGESVAGGDGGPIDIRLKRDIISYTPNVVVICLGLNDAAYKPFDQTRYDNFVNGYGHILSTLRASLPNVRLVLLTPHAFDEVTHPTSGYLNDVLVKFGAAL